jgi:hypothetical protein
MSEDTTDSPAAAQLTPPDAQLTPAQATERLEELTKEYAEQRKPEAVTEAATFGLPPPAEFETVSHADPFTSRMKLALAHDLEAIGFPPKAIGEVLLVSSTRPNKSLRLGCGATVPCGTPSSQRPISPAMLMRPAR